MNLIEAVRMSTLWGERFKPVTGSVWILHDPLTDMFVDEDGEEIAFSSSMFRDDYETSPKVEKTITLTKGDLKQVVSAGYRKWEEDYGGLDLLHFVLKELDL